MRIQDGARLGPILITLFAVALLLLFVGSIAQVLVLLFMAGLLGTYFCSFTDALARMIRVPRVAALTFSILLTIFGVFSIGALVLPPVVAQTQELLTFLPEAGDRAETFVRGLAVQYPVLGGGLLETEQGELANRLMAEFRDYVSGSLLGYLTTGGVLAIELFGVLAMAIYFARDPVSYREGFIAMAPPKVRHIVRRTVADLSDTIRAWISGQLLAMVFLAVVTAAGLWALRVPYALAFGVFTGAVSVVPFFGTIVSTLLPATFVVATGGWGQAIAVVFLGIGVHLIEANVVVPMIFQVRIKLPPVLTIVSVLVAATLLGPLGLVVAVPLLAAVIVVVRHVLIGQIYGDVPAGARISAVLVPTQEYRQVVTAQ